MKHAAIDAVFQPKLNKQETKADAITRNVREILDAEAIKRDAKTERLRLARLARDAAMPALAVKKVRTVVRHGK